jgi:hypothetical protein
MIVVVVSIQTFPIENHSQTKSTETLYKDLGSQDDLSIEYQRSCREVNQQ